MNSALCAFLYARGLVGEDLGLTAIAAQADLVQQCLVKLRQDLDTVCEDDDEVTIQSVFYEAGKLHFASELRWWFKVLYQVLLSQDEGPRLGQFAKLMSIYWIQQKIDAVLQDYWAVSVGVPAHNQKG